MRGCLTTLAFVAGLLILAGLSGWVGTGSDATAYQNSAHEDFPATIVSAEDRYVTDPGASRSHSVCIVQLEGTFGTPTLQIDDVSGACDRTSPLKPGAAVEAEVWRGKV